MTDSLLLRAWLRSCEPEIRQPFTHGVLLIASIREAAEMAIDTLLDVLGCRKRQEIDVRSLAIEDLEECVSFLRWLLELTLTAPDDVTVRRTAVEGGGTLYRESRRDLGTCERALAMPVGWPDDTTARDLVAIGEVGPGIRYALRTLPGLPRPGSMSCPDRHLSDPRGALHIAPRTLVALLRYSNHHDDHALSVAHALTLLRHVDSCLLCAEAYGKSATALGLSVR